MRDWKMTNQNKITETATDEFTESLNLTPEKIQKDMEKMKDVEGFPIGDDNDILELSNPPYYTAYPNPYIKDFVAKYGTPYDEETDDYHREPFVGDVSATKHSSIYGAHTYHTKVPHQAIIEYIKHYTNQKDIVFDGFCGSGMTGVAAKITNRFSIICDLGVAAGYISGNYVNPLSLDSYKIKFQQIVQEAYEEVKWVYETRHTNGEKGNINFVVWSDQLICPFCNHRFYIGDSNKNIRPGSEKDNYCPNCKADISNAKLDKNKDKDGKVITKPILINYTYNKKRFDKCPDDIDFEIINKLNSMEIPFWVPLYDIPDGHNTAQPKRSHNITNAHEFYTKRNLYVLSSLYDKFKHDLRYWFFVNSIIQKASKLMTIKKDYVGRITTGTLYISSLTQEVNVFHYLKIQSKQTIDFLIELNKSDLGKSIVSTQSLTDMRNLPENSVDYIFTDPPFGENLMYSELNFIWESWFKVFSNNNHEAIINKTQNKELNDYRDLMIKCMESYFKILKPNRWITVEFHNSKAQIWKIIQESIVKAGFIIGQVAVLDKKIGSFKQVTSPGSVKNDLIINAYKPSDKFSTSFLKKAGLNLEKDFIQMHLDKLPIEPNIERTQQMLYSKLLAQYIQNGFEVRMDASEFYGMLNTHFTERDGYWFNKDQISEYEKRLNLSKNIGKFNLNQSILGISDEKTAIIWLAQFIRTPKTYDEIHIEFSKNPMFLTSEDQIPELKVILDENFATESGKYRLPSVREKKEKENMRDKRLSKEFESIVQKTNSGKKITEVRKEALLHGLMKLYQDKNVKLINLLGQKLDQKIIDSDDDISAIIEWASFKSE